MTKAWLYRGGEGHATDEGFALPGAEPSYAPDLALEPVHLEIRLRFDIEQAVAVGSVTTLVQANRGDARTIVFDAVGLEDVQVSAGASHEIHSRYDGRSIHVTWRHPFQPGEQRQVTVSYRVEEPVSGMHFSRPDPHYPDRPIFVATDHETERARYWLPCVDYPTVRPRYDFYLTAAADLTCLANGVLEGVEANGEGTQTHHWKLDAPCPSYLCCLAVGRFVRVDDGDVDGCPIAYFTVEPFSADSLRRSFGRTGAMMRWLTEKLAHPFPYPKYFQIALPEIGGAMENISLVTWDAIFLLNEPLAEEWTQVVDSINIHEMAHSYFGDAIVCRHFEHSWLKESWATYVETLWWEDHGGRDDRDFDLILNGERYIEEAEQRYARPIVTREYSSSWDLFDAHLYPGGAWRIHMLRNLVGESAFWRGVESYVGAFSGRIVETDDFRRELERHSGLNLTRFFDQWIYSPGYPKLKVSFAHDAERGQATFTVEQTQRNEQKGIGLFSFPLEIEVHDGTGAQRFTLAIEEIRHTRVLAMAATPHRVRVDPDSKVLFALDFNPGEDLLRRALGESEDIGNRLRAARALVKIGTRPSLDSVARAMKQEPFWGVRALVAQTLGESGSAAAVEPLAAMLLGEEDPRAKAMIARGTSKLRDPRLADALREFLARKEPPWARAAALGALGAQREERHLDVLRAAAEERDLHSIVRSGAWRALGELRSERAFEVLGDRLASGVEPEYARPGAVDGFGASALLQDPVRQREAAERLADLTRDPHARVRMRAAAALARIPAAIATPALEALKARQPAQDGPNIERLLARHRRGAAGDDVRALRKRVEELEARSQKLEERVQDCEGKVEEGGEP